MSLLNFQKQVNLSAIVQDLHHIPIIFTLHHIFSVYDFKVVLEILQSNGKIELVIHLVWVQCDKFIQSKLTLCRAIIAICSTVKMTFMGILTTHSDNSSLPLQGQWSYCDMSMSYGIQYLKYVENGGETRFEKSRARSQSEKISSSHQRNTMASRRYFIDAYFKQKLSPPILDN